MTDPGSQRSKRMPQNCPAEIADEKPSRRQFLDLKLIDHVNTKDWTLSLSRRVISCRVGFFIAK